MSILLAPLMVLVTAAGIPAQTAMADLGFSGARLIVISTGDFSGQGARRILTLVGPNGFRRSAQLRGGRSLNLYHLRGHPGAEFVALNAKDCFKIDPIHIQLQRCKAPRCGSRFAAGVYLGRFDWMNGFDPPKGHFRLGFRYLPFYDAAEDLHC